MSAWSEVDWVVVFGFDLTGPSVQSTYHYARFFLASGKRVLWVNPIPVRNPTLKRLGRRRSLLAKLRHKIRGYAKPLRKRADGIVMFTPLYYPRVEDDDAWKLNSRILRWQYRILFRILGVRRYGIWVAGSFTGLPLIQMGHHRFLVYQAADFISDMRDVPASVREVLRSREQQLALSADWVFPASYRIQERLREIGVPEERLRLLPHGVDWHHFARDVPVARELKDLPRPVVGYFGSLTDANDQDAFLHLAEAGFTVVLIGKVLGDYSRCQNHPRIMFLGPIDYERLPMYGKGMDVCLLPWRPAAWIENCFPKKTMEYLALGKPIVASPIPEVRRRFGDLVYFASESADFVALTKRALEEDSEALRQARRERVRKEGWEARFEVVEECLSRL